MRTVLPLIFTLITTLLMALPAAAHQFVNPSIEGTPTQGVPPTGWDACGNSTPDTQPGSYNVTTPASDGNTYISLVTRGPESPLNGTTESVLGEMDVPFVKDIDYTIKIDLAYSKEFAVIDPNSGLPISYGNPIKLRVYTGTTSCDHSEFFWESPTIDHTDWRTYTIHFKLLRNANPIIQFEANYAGGASPYPGNILVDNVRVDACSFASPIETVAYNRKICVGDSVLLDATTPNGRYSWADGRVTPAITVKEPGTFVVDVSNGCIHQSFSYVVTQSLCDCPIQFPNVFTPNDDGSNDAFEIIGSSDVARYQLKIFNRWGEQVFASQDLGWQWDGRVKGNSTQGVYYWIADVQCLYNRRTVDGTYKGWVSIVK